jgi:hypothetical protein
MPMSRITALALVVTLGTVGLTAVPASAAGPAGPVTRAALDPALVAGRGADLGFLEQEAESARTTGAVIGPDRTAYSLPSEASGRRAVKLAPGQYVEFTLPRVANAISVRYSIPDARTAAASPRRSTSPSTAGTGRRSR